MSASSLELFPLSHDTDRTVFDEAAALEEETREAPVAVWKAGELTVRPLPARAVGAERRRTDYVHLLTSDSGTICPRLIADIEAVACEEAHRPVPSHGFRDQFIGFVGASLTVLSGLGVLAGLVTPCAVIIGVVLPFGLFS